MATQIDVLSLGGFTFTGFSPPDLLPVGGKQQMQVHKLPGGARVIDTMGPDEDDISWHGTFFQNDALNVCVQLDALRKSGQLVTLTFAGQSRQVVVGSFIYSIRRFPMWVEYVISCVVNTGPPAIGGASSSPSGIDNSTSSDASQGTDVGNGSASGDVWGTTGPGGVDVGGTGAQNPSVTIGTPTITGSTPVAP